MPRKEPLNKKELFSTTIDSSILSNFRDYCRSVGMNMNIVLETFMAQFADGQFVFKLSKQKMEIDENE